MTNDKEKKSLSRRKVYLLLISLTAVIGSLICLGAILEHTLKNRIITDEEYLYRFDYQIENCKFGEYDEPTKERKIKTEKERELCEKEESRKILMKRKATYKEQIIRFSSRGSLFLILLITHLPIFIKQTKDEKNK